MEHKGTDNLIPFNELTQEEQRAIASAGGKASGKARRKKRDLKKILELILSQPSKNVPEIDKYTEICLAQVEKASAGDTKAFVAVRDTIGQKPAEKIEADVNTNTINIKIEE